MEIDYFENAELTSIRKFKYVMVVGYGDGDGAALKRLPVNGFIEVERGQVFEHFLAVRGIEMHGDSVEGRDDIDDFGDGM